MEMVEPIGQKLEEMTGSRNGQKENPETAKNQETILL